MSRPALQSTLLASLAAITLTAGLMVSGTVSSNSAQPPAEPVPAAEPGHSYVWSADADIDLFARGPELVRATFEASWVWARNGENPFFPGYFDALQYTEFNRLDNFSSLALEPRYNGGIASTTDYTHITEFSATDTAISAFVCSYPIFTEAYPKPASARDWFVVSYEVNLVLPDGMPGQPGLRDSQPGERHPAAQSSPGWNVFGDWRITKSVYQHPADTPHGCLDWFQEHFPDFTPIPGENGLHVPAGFEPPAHPVALQYPEWIGPWQPQ